MDRGLNANHESQVFVWAPLTAFKPALGLIPTQNRRRVLAVMLFVSAAATGLCIKRQPVIALTEIGCPWVTEMVKCNRFRLLPSV